MVDENMALERRRGPSTYTLSFAGIIAVAGLLAMGVATYNAVQNDIASLKRSNLHQEGINRHLTEEIQSVWTDQRDAMKEFNGKLDSVINNIENDPKEKSCGI